MIVIILLGLSAIGVGFLVRKYPDVIAGYNTMSKEKKALIDIDGLSAMMFRSFVITGNTIVTVTLFCMIFRIKEEFPIYFSIIVFTLGIIYMCIRSFSFNNKPKRK